MLRRILLLAAIVGICFMLAPAPEPLTVQASQTSRPTLMVPLHTDASPEDYDQLIRTEPLKAFVLGIQRIRRDVQSYRATLIKRERVHGVLGEREVIQVVGRAEPFSVRMQWKEGARATLGTKTEGALFVEGENSGKIKVWRPSAFLSALRVMEVSPTDDRARSSSRYAINEGGLLSINERTLHSWTESRDRNPETWPERRHFLGLMPVKELGGRQCYVLERFNESPELDRFSHGDPPPVAKDHPADVFTHVRIMIDAETWLQVGAELKRADGEWIGYYYFRDVEVNPKMSPNQFTVDAFRR